MTHQSARGPVHAGANPPHLTGPPIFTPRARGNAGLVIGVLFEQSKQAVNIAENPQVGNLVTIERKQSRPEPLNRLVRWPVAEELAPMDAGETHAREGFRVPDNKIEYVATITAKSGMREIDVGPKPLVANLRLTE